MLTAEQQQEIIATNDQALEKLARQWRDPRTGQLEPDLEVAVRQMVCDYFSVPGCCNDAFERNICELQEAAEEASPHSPHG